MNTDRKIPFLLALALMFALIAAGCTASQTAATPPSPQGSPAADQGIPTATAVTGVSPVRSLAVKNTDTMEIHGWVTEMPGPWEGTHNNRIGPGETLTLLSPVPAESSHKSVCIGAKDKTLKCTQVTGITASVISWNGKDLA